jgi:hypothetical protein
MDKKRIIPKEILLVNSVEDKTGIIRVTFLKTVGIKVLCNPQLFKPAPLFIEVFIP